MSDQSIKNVADDIFLRKANEAAAKQLEINKQHSQRSKLMPKILPKSAAPAAPAAPTAAARVAAAQPGKKVAPTTTPPATEPATNGEAPRQVPRQVREVLYPKVEAEICIGDNALTAAVWKEILGWETEADHQKRMCDENPGTKPDHWTYGEAYMLRDENGDKVQCFHNLDNRPFDETWMRSLAQVHLRGQWAGGITIPGGTINGSTVVLSNTGRVESGQHSGAALIIAQQIYDKNPDLYPHWKATNGPVMETIIIKGISEDPRVTMTVDNCKPRSMADVFYTSELFRNLASAERKECSKMMANASDHLWKRTAAVGYKTPPEMVGFVDRHARLVKCVEHLFQENKSERRISKLRVTPGLAASLCYLMGASSPDTDGDVYRNGFPPSEKDAAVNWDRWSKAREFWAMVGSHDTFKPVRAALAQLMESSVDNTDNLGLGGRVPERLAVVQKAWDTFIAHDQASGAPVFDMADLAEGGALYLSYNNLDDSGNVLADGEIKLLDRADFMGIDCPDEDKGGDTGEPPPRTTAEIQAEREKVDRERAEAELAKQAQQRAAAPSAKAAAVARLKALSKSK